MTCSQARDAMLSADLRIETGPLAEHLRGCDRCHALAKELMADLDALRMTVRRKSSRRVRMVVLPLAAAIVGMVMAPAHAGHTSAPVNAVTVPVVSVDAGPGQTAAVISTKDPKVTIVILSPGN